MPQVKCPQCGAVRLVVEGKKKNCRKCGQPLTANMAPSTSSEQMSKQETQSEMTAEDLQKQYPQQVEEIIKVVQLKAEAEALKRKTGEMTAEILLNTYPNVVAEISEAITAEVTEKITAEAAAKTKAEIGKMDIKVFAEQFPKLFSEIAAAVKRTMKKGKGKDGSNTGSTT